MSLTTMIGIYTAASGVYFVAGIVLLCLVKLLLRRWRMLTWRQLFVSSAASATVALVTFLFLLTFVEANVGGGSGIGAVVFAVVAFLLGAVVGCLALCISAFSFSNSQPPDKRLAARSSSATRVTLMYSALMFPGFFAALQLGDRQPSLYVAFFAMLLGVAGLRESLLLEKGEDSFSITRWLLWAGLFGTIAMLVDSIVGFIASGSLLHSRQLSMLTIVLLSIAIPAGVFLWRLRSISTEN